jgi:allantoin racemase
MAGTDTIGLLVPMSGLDEPERRLRRDIAQSLVPAELSVEILANAAGPPSLASEEDFDQAIVTAAELVASLDQARVGVLVLSGAVDPGLDALRSASPVPVVGPGEASLQLAALFGRPLSIVTVNEPAAVAARRFVEDAEVKPSIASIRSIDVPVPEIVLNRQRGSRALARECARAVEDDRAEAIFLGSMTLGTLAITETLQRGLGVPVFDPMRIAMATAAQCCFARSITSA